MKPFLFLGTRAEDLAADGEYDAVLRFSGLDERDLHRVRLERDPLADTVGDPARIDLTAYSGIVLGGGPFTVSDPDASKSAAQRRAEAELRTLALRVVEEDTPFLGACYGIGTLGSLHGGVVDRTYGEPIGAVPITLTDAGAADPLLGGLPATFDAFLGHKEAVRDLPRGAVRLAGAAGCPVQAFRIGERVYATQFHPELDVEGLVTRIEVYRDYGYFDPPDAITLIRAARAAVVTEPPRLLARFVELFAR